MPNSASALAASFMISRSESLPMTMETRGLLVIDSNLLLLPQVLQPPRGDVFAVVHAVEADLHHGVVCPFDGLRQIGASGGDAQNAPTRSVISAVALIGPSMEDFCAKNPVGVFDAGNDFAGLE